MSISHKVLIMTTDEHKEMLQEKFNDGVKRGRYDQQVDWRDKIESQKKLYEIALDCAQMLARITAINDTNSIPLGFFLRSSSIAIDISRLQERIKKATEEPNGN